jgi:hypothetical protein
MTDARIHATEWGVIRFLIDEGHRDEAWDELMKIYRHVQEKYEDQPFGMLDVDTFVPFDTAWNRKTHLLVEEIKMANNKHLGVWSTEARRELDRQWKLSGMTPPGDKRGCLITEMP